MANVTRTSSKARGAPCVRLVASTLVLEVQQSFFTGCRSRAISDNYDEKESEVLPIAIEFPTSLMITFYKNKCLPLEIIIILLCLYNNP